MAIDYNKKRKVVISRREIDRIEKRLAKQIMKDYKGKELLVVGLMNGSILFLADMLKKLKMDIEVEPLKIYTYSKTEERKLDTKRIKQHFCWPRLRDRHVLVLDELLDSGDTLDYVTKKIRQMSKPKSLKTCVLLAKDYDRPYPIRINYCGKKIKNDWITGYGMGYKYKFRNLLDIVILTDEEKASVPVRKLVIPCKK